MSEPLVSIVIPAFNPAFFQAALSSALSQTRGNVEVVVCDDSGTERVKQTCDALAAKTSVPLRYVRNRQRLGFLGNLMKCLDEAQGELIKFLCDDDLLYTGCVEAQADVLARYPETSVVLAPRRFCDADDFDLPARFENSPLVSENSLFKGHDVLALLEHYPTNFLGNLSSAMFRRSDVAAVLPSLAAPGSGFVALLDLVLFVCVMGRGNLVVLNQILSVERLQPARLSRQQAVRDMRTTEVRLLVQMLQARGGERAPAPGWVRVIPLARALEQPREWNERHFNQELGTRQRSLLSRVGMNSESFSDVYLEWLACRTLSATQEGLLPDIIASWPKRPRIVPIVVSVDGDTTALAMTLESIAVQQYSPSLVVVLSSHCNAPRLDDAVLYLPLHVTLAVQLNTLLGQLEDVDWIYLLQAGDRLMPAALLLIADRVAHHDSLTCLFGDEGAIAVGESAEPVFKPDFNLDLLRAFPYVGRALAFARQVAFDCGGFDASAGELCAVDLLWRLFEQGGAKAIHHVAEILLESQLAFGQWLASPDVVNANAAVVEAHLRRLGVRHRIAAGRLPWINVVRYEYPEQTAVSIVIVVKDQLAALQRCLESFLQSTAYSNFDILLVDNGSRDAATHGWLSGMAQMGSDRLRVMTLAGAPLGEVLNHCVLQARGDHVLIASPYLVATHPDWLDELVQHARRAEVAVVSPLLYNAAACIQDAGLILGLNDCAGFAFKGEPMSAQGYMARLEVAHDLSAVGADCLMVVKQRFTELGGFDATRFGDDGFVLDFCLRAGEAGYLVVWNPAARLARGRAPDDSFLPFSAPDVQAAIYERWLPTLARDPAYNQNLTLTGLGFRLNPGLKTGWTPFTNRRLPSILALPINATAVGHYRVIQPFTELEAARRVVGRVCYDQPSWIEIERQTPELIILQGRYGVDSPREIAALRKYTKARLIYELDDYVLDVPAKNAHVRKRISNLDEVVRSSIAQCDRLVVSTHALADKLAGMHSDTRVVPNMLAPHLWSHLRSVRRSSRKPRVGWGGGTSHTGDLELIAEVVRQLAGEVEWIFFGMCPEVLRPYIHEFHSTVGMAQYPAKLASLNLDLALAPLEHHVFNDCKSNLRLLEYGACGYPVICSDTLAYRGYLPCTRVVSNSTEEWIDAIRQHLADPDASYRQGDALRETVLRDYMLRGDNLQYWEDAWLS